MEARGSEYGGTVRSRTGGKHVLLEPRESGAPFRVELRSPAEMASEVAAWRGLAARALEPNVFAEPEFLAAALKHGGQARRVALLAVWQGPALRGLLPFVPPRLPFAPGEARLWRPDLAASGPPLIDRGAPETVLEEMLGFLAGLGTSHAALALPRSPLDGAFAAALRAVAERTGRRIGTANAAEQAVLHAGAGGEEAFGRSPPERPSPATRGGDLRVESARDPRQIRDAVEEFLALDARSAQAHGVPALIEEAGAALLVRTLTRELARARRCRVDLLRVGERAVAGAIVLRSGDRAWLWRIVGEDGSDGVQPARLLASAIARSQAQRRSVASTASCFPLHGAAVAGIWRGREAVADLTIATRPGREADGAPLRSLAGRALRGLAGRVRRDAAA